MRIGLFDKDGAGWGTYRRPAEEDGWSIEEFCGDAKEPLDLTGYDAASAIRQFLRESGNEGRSACEVLMAEGAEGVGTAVAFVSHVQKEPVWDTLKALWLIPTTERENFMIGAG